MPLFYSYQAYFGRYKVKTLSSGLRCIVWWELSLITVSFFIKSIAMFKRKICFKALAIQWSKPVPRKWRGPVISQLYMCWVDFSYQSHDWLVVCFTLKLGCPFFYTGSLVFRFSWFFLDSWSWRWILSFILFMLFSSYCTYFVYFRCRHLCIAELYLY